MSEQVNKPRLWRYIIERMFCHHQYLPVEKIDRYNVENKVVSTVIMRECSLCGKTKVTTLEFR